MNLRIVNIDGYEMDVELFPHILVLSNIDKPGGSWKCWVNAWAMQYKYSWFANGKKSGRW